MRNIIVIASCILFQFQSAYLIGKDKPRPNIIWVIAEDMSRDLGCYGNTIVKTSNIDDLASKGMQFNNTYATAGVCAPSRTAIATGMYQNTLGACHLRYPDNLMPQLPDNVKIVSHILKENGYQTLGQGKDDFMFQLEERSFEIDEWQKLDPQKPFFAKICSSFSHRVFYPDKDNPVDPNQVKLPPYYPNVNILREDWALYLENVQKFDQQLGRLLESLEELNLLENTIIFFFSDHGRAMLRGKYWLYDSGVKVPLIVWASKETDPLEGYNKGSVSSQLVSTIDISATTLSLAGLKKPSYMTGKVFLGKDMEENRKYAFASADRIGGVHLKSRMITDGRYKLIVNHNNGLSVLENSTEHRKAKLPACSTIKIMDDYNLLEGAEVSLVNPLPLVELFDLEQDPFEVNNLAGNKEFGEVKKSLQEALEEWTMQIDDQCIQQDSPEIITHFVDYRLSHRKKFTIEKKEMYLKVRDALEKEGKL